MHTHPELGVVQVKMAKLKQISYPGAFFFPFYVQQGGSQVHQQHFVDQEGRKLHFSLTVAEHV